MIRSFVTPAGWELLHDPADGAAFLRATMGNTDIDLHPIEGNLYIEIDGDGSLTIPRDQADAFIAAVRWCLSRKSEES